MGVVITRFKAKSQFKLDWNWYLTRTELGKKSFQVKLNTFNLIMFNESNTVITVNYGNQTELS